MKILTSEQMAYLDKTTIDNGTPGHFLMRNAGDSVADVIFTEFHPSADSKVVVISGKGNNGGDGFRVAKALLQKGLKPYIFLLAEKSDIKGDALTCFNDVVSCGIKIFDLKNKKNIKELSKKLSESSIVVDAIFGTGLKGPINGLTADVIELINNSGKKIISVDIPSGVNGSTGEIANIAVKADITVTFGFMKVGHVFKPGKLKSGKVIISDIGFDKKISSSIKPFALTFNEHELLSIFPKRNYNTYKSTAGKVFVIASSVGMTGAAALCAKAALLTGAGVVTVGCPESLNDILEIKLTEPMTIPLPEVRKKRCLSVRALGKIREVSENFDIIAIGPGIGTYFETMELVRRFICNYTGKIVLDADGIKAFSSNPGLLKSSKAEIILTPHPGELSVLINIPVSEILERPMEYALKASSDTGKIVLLKGHNTFIASPYGDIFINSTGNEGMATAGMGDVLTGTIAGLAAQGIDLLNATLAGAYIHGLSGDISSKIKGIHSLIASDVLENIPEAIMKLKKLDI